MPEITRKTDKELPRYLDAEESDTFILSGAEDLVPVADISGTIIETAEGDNKIRRYYPRTEGLNAKIERITKPSGEIYWRVTSKDNIVSLYGFTSSSRIADPEKPERRIFSWRLERTMDSLGNYAEYEYAHDDSAEYSSLYLSAVKYGNAVPATDIESTYSGGFYFSLEFDYRDSRFDSFSVFKPGFEVRNTKLCSSIRMMHNINTADKKVKELALTHSHAVGLSLLMSAKLTGYDSANNAAGLPQIDFEYSLPHVSGKTKELDQQDLENMPAGLSGEVSFSDLWNEGISGVLVKSSNAWYYKSNLGNIRWLDENGNDEIDLGKLFVLKEFPSLAIGGMESAQLTDIDGDGLNEIQILSGNIKGWHSFDESGKLSPFAAFKQMPNIDMNDPNIQMIDLNGDGYPDMLFSGNDCFLVSYSKAKGGYGELQRISKAISEEEGPRVIFNEQQQSIFIADMSGDGLNDIVRIKNGSVCYWPNLGYGRFGKKRRMKKAPAFDHADMFDSSRIRLADIDGSGTADIIYLGARQTFYWKNQSGNEWSEGMPVPNFPKTDSLTNVSVFDIEGNGTSAIVWSSPLPGTRDRIKYIELTSGEKPFLLTSIKNNMGAERNLFYAPSTKFYLQDKRAGKPWITKLGFPVHVVERMEVIDNPTASRYVNRYAYHHGYFDGAEREFRGFGMVEQWDTDNYGASASLSTRTILSLSGAEGDASILQGSGVSTSLNTRATQSLSEVEGNTPPVYTKTWFHTGYYRNADNISDLYSHEYYQENPEWRLPDTTVPDGLTPHEKREAARVLKGSMLRQEAYSQDGSDKQNIPYSVTENSYLIKVRQRKLENKHAVFMVLPEESIVLSYERNADDPRIVHKLVLETDEYGNMRKKRQK